MTNQNFPENLLYNQDYSWIKIDDDTATLGVVQPAADKVQEFVFAKLPKEGDVLKKGETYISLEALKWSGQLSTPLSGKVIAVNQEVFNQPSIINQDPYGKGWVVKIKISHPKEKEDLLTADEIKND